MLWLLTLATSRAFDPAYIERLQADVARIRGESWRAPVEVKGWQPSDVAAFVRADLEKQQAKGELAEVEASLKALGVLAPEDDFAETMVSLGGSQVAGLYDPAARTLYVVDTPAVSGSVTGIVLVHELAHALDDQLFDLQALTTADYTLDAEFGVRALMEGSASWVMEEWTKGAIQSHEIQLGDLLKSGLSGSKTSNALFHAAPFYTTQLLAPYGVGLHWLKETQAGASLGEHTRQAFAAIPATSATVLSPHAPPTAPLDLSPRQRSLQSAWPGWALTLSDALGQIHASLVWRGPDAYPRKITRDPSLFSDPLALQLQGDALWRFTQPGAGSEGSEGGGGRAAQRVAWYTVWASTEARDEFVSKLQRSRRLQHAGVTVAPLGARDAWVCVGASEEARAAAAAAWGGGQ